MTRAEKVSAAPSDLAAQRAALERALAAKLRALRALRKEETSSWDRGWEIVAEILEHEPPLWRGAYASESAFIRAELPGETMRSVRRNALVARTFRPADIEARGPHVLEEIALYLQERGGAARPARAVDLSRVVVMVPEGAGLRRVAAAAVEIEQVRAARRKLRHGSAGGRKVGPVERAIRAELEKKAALRGITVRTEGEHASLGNVPVTALGELAAALAKVRLPRS